MAMNLDYFVVDVFTDRQLTGNPLAVVLNPGLLSTEDMQAIARETNLSETTFVERRSPSVERSEGIRVRIFTTQEELNFAGHPTLGTASLLRFIAPECIADESITLALNVGPIEVRFESQSPNTPPWPMRGEMTQRDPEFGAILAPVEVAALTGISLEDFDPVRPIQIVSTGTAFAIVPLRSAHALAALNVRQREAGAYLRARGARWFYVVGPTGLSHGAQSGGTAEPSWRARMQFEGGEDPATGSAAGCAISHLVRHGAVGSNETIHLRQGVEIHRSSDLFLTATLRQDTRNRISEPQNSPVTQVRVGGSTVLVAKGQLFLP